MFYWTDRSGSETFDPKNRLWVNLERCVMQYFKNAKVKRASSQKNVDTGMAWNASPRFFREKKSCYDTELSSALRQTGRTARVTHPPERNAPVPNGSLWSIPAADIYHGGRNYARKVDQPYVLAHYRADPEPETECRSLFTGETGCVVIEQYKEFYPELEANGADSGGCSPAGEQFQQALEKGTAEFEKLIARVPAHIQNKVVSGKNAFYLYETFGFPIELTVEMAQEKGFKVDLKGYEEAYAKHQELSRKGAEQKFKGGLADHSEESAQLHTATHLLHAALRKVLGPHVAQKGSNINAERLRFDFSHPDKMTPEQLAEVERLVNEAIAAKAPIVCEEMTVDEAKAQGAIGLFGDKYGEKVRVYTMGSFSMEICGGPHAENTEQLGHFKLLKERVPAAESEELKQFLRNKQRKGAS